ncbi:MAG: hypothetical protein EBT43_03200 [Methylocystaceae bacterium]|nr:hypothetical protein [Methylocystaceae bacterium]
MALQIVPDLPSAYKRKPAVGAACNLRPKPDQQPVLNPGLKNILTLNFSSLCNLFINRIVGRNACAFYPCLLL